MALIKCDECGRDVSDKAVSCPNCGNPITDSYELDEIDAPNEVGTPTKVTKQQDYSGLANNTFFLNCCFAFFAIVFIVFLVSQNSPIEEAREAKESTKAQEVKKAPEVKMQCDDLSIKKRYVHRQVNLRYGPGTNFTILKKLSKNDEVEVGQFEKGWASICSDGSIFGYVSASLLKTSRLATRTKKDSSKKSPPPYIDPYTADDPFLAGALNELRKIDAELGF